MNFIRQVLRTALFLVLALFGVVMALVFMVSTALAIGILYIVARVHGRPFGVKAYWAERRRSMPRRGGTRTHGDEQDVVDIEMREIP